MLLSRRREGPITLASISAVLACSAAALALASWLLLRAATARARETLARERHELDRERQRALGAITRAQLRAARLTHPRVAPRRSERVAVEAERRARR